MLCPGCKKKGFAKFLEKTGQYNLFICNACALTFCEPMQPATGNFYELKAQYEDKWEFGFICQKMQQLGLSGELLDIGCGDGIFMEMASKQFAVAGIDINMGALKAAKLKRNLNDTYPITLKEHINMFPAKKYDIITAFHILEHVGEPAEFITDIKHSLKPQGIAVISIPNPNRWTLRWVREAWDYPPHHLTRWTTYGLCALLESRGLNVLEVFYERISFLSQIRDAMRDIIWSVVFKKFSFKVASRINLSKERFVLWPFLVNIKGKVIKLLAFSLALITYPVFRLGNFTGKSLLVLAKPKD